MVAHDDVLQARLRPPRRRDSRGGASPHRLGRTSNREGIGARLTVEAGDLTLTREVDGGFAYASASERDPHFGLGDATEVTRLTVRWPSGIEQVLEDVPVNTWLDVVEPDPWRSSASNRPEGRIERQGRAKGAPLAPRRRQAVSCPLDPAALWCHSRSAGTFDMTTSRCYLRAVMAAPKQITLRHPSPELARRLKAIAEARGESLNSTILSLLADAVGVDERRRRLDRYATWTDDDLEAFEAALKEQRTIDVELWK